MLPSPVKPFRVLLGALVLAVGSLAACDKPPVAWNDPVPLDQPQGPTKLVVSGATARFVVDSVRSASLPAVPGLCNSTFVTASGIKDLHAAWWNVRADSSSVLLIAASSDSGRTWGKPTAVDTTDISSTGCKRPPPSLVTVADDVYVAYSMIAPEGKGVFFAHTMGNMLHSPVPVIYGERLVATAIAADAMRVAVAYEEPNGTRQQVDVALSGTQGHIFELHTTASRSVDIATQPAVAFNGPSLAVSWVTRRSSDSSAVRVVRIGQIQQP